MRIGITGVVLLAIASIAGSCSESDSSPGGNASSSGAGAAGGTQNAGGESGSGQSDGGESSGGAPQAGGASGTGGAPGAGSGGSSGGMPDSGGASGAGGESSTFEAVRFVVLGDTGAGNQAQYDVAAQIDAWCELEGCDFVILLGNNIYDDGVESVDDPQWQAKFELPYAAIDLPFYAVLGNHDYGGFSTVSVPGLGNEFDKGPYQVAYGAVSARFEMPATHYTFRRENVGFVMLDTNSILWDDTTNGDQESWFDPAVAALRADGAQWIVVSGHHPYRSNGAHGNAGNYEGIESGGVIVPNPLPIMDGANVADFYDDFLCGEVDVVFAGHDHNRQWLNEPTALCGAELIVSGAGSKLRSFESTSNTLHYGDDTTEGFMYVVIEGDTMTGRFIDKLGTTNFQRQVTRSP